MSYSSAAALLESYPRKLQILENVYRRPSYYAVYFTTGIKGNLNLRGTAAAESNHLAIARNFGDSGAWNVVYHIK